MTSTWLIVLAIVSLVLAFISAGFILIDELTGDRPLMPVMKWVWPITALYMGPLAIWAYWSMDRSEPMEHGGQEHQDQPFWQAVFKGVTHCGAGCTLGDIIAEWTVFIAGFTLAGLAIWPEYIADYILALALGIAFQYFAIAPMRGLGPKDGTAAP